MIHKLVPCGNPAVNQLLGVSKRSIPADTFQPIYRMGVKYCAWCASKPTRNNRAKYCGTQCQESCYLSCYPQSDNGIAYLFMERGCHCAACGFSWADFLGDETEKYKDSLRRRIDQSKSDQEEARNILRTINNGVITVGVVYRLKPRVPKIKSIEVDHIVPVALGGTTFGFENLQLLCYECHKQKTKTDMVEIRKSKEGA